MPRTIHKVLITGASGKLGAPLCRALLAAGYQVLALRHRNSVGIDGVEEVQGSVADAGLIEDAGRAQRCRDPSGHLQGRPRSTLLGQPARHVQPARSGHAHPLAATGHPGQRRCRQWHLFQSATGAHSRRFAAGRLSGLLRTFKSARRDPVSAVLPSGGRARPSACASPGSTPTTIFSTI